MVFKRRRNGLAKQVRKNARKIKKINAQVEAKESRISVVTNLELNEVDSITTLSVVAQGLDDDDRIGNTIFCKNIMIRGILHNDHGTPVDALVRLIVFRWKNPRSDVPATSSGVLESLAINSMRDWKERDQFVVMYDNTFSLDTTQHTKVPFKIRLKINKKIMFNASTKSATAAETNGIYISSFSDVTGTTNNPRMDVQSRMTFTDA